MSYVGDFCNNNSKLFRKKAYQVQYCITTPLGKFFSKTDVIQGRNYLKKHGIGFHHSNFMDFKLTQI